MAYPSLADAFVGTYTAMKQTQQRDKELQMEQARQAAQQEYQNAVQRLNQQKFQYEIDPNSPENQLKATQTDYYANRLPAQEAATAQREERLGREATARESHQQAIEKRTRLKDALAAWMGTGTAPGVSPEVAMLGLLPEEQDDFKNAIHKIQMDEWQRKLNKGVDAASEEISKYQSPLDALAAPGQPQTQMPAGAPAGAMGAAGAALGGPVGAALAGAAQAQPAAPSQAPGADQGAAGLLQALGGGLDAATAIGEAFKKHLGDVGAPPTLDDVMNAKSPNTLALEAKLGYQQRLAEANIALKQSQKARTDLLMQTDPELRQSLIDARKAREDHMKAIEDQRAANEKWREYYQGQRLNQAKVDADIRRGFLQNARANTQLRAQGMSEEYKNAISDSRTAREVAKWEYMQNTREIDKEQAALDAIRTKAAQWAAAISAAPNAAPEDPVPGFSGMTYGQVRGFVTAANEELDPNNPSSRAFRVSQMRADNATLQASAYGNGPQKQAVSPYGQVITPPLAKGSRTAPPPAVAPRTGVSVGQQFLQRNLPRR